MPEIGEIKTGKEIGRGKTQTWQKFMWIACEICGKKRWGPLRHGKPLYKQCYACTRTVGKLKRKSDSRGYIDVLLESNDFFYPMANKLGWVAEHRLVVAKRLGRCLHSWEFVHHIDHIRDHNEDSNLQLLMDMGHKQLTKLEEFISKLQRKIETLEIENSRLRER